MRRAGRTGSGIWRIGLGAGLALAVAGLFWREVAHARERADWTAEAVRHERQVAELEAAREGMAAELAEAVKALREAEATALSQADRISNLEAQRDHLRAEAERQDAMARQAEAATEQLQTALEDCRAGLMQAQLEPAALRTELAQARLRVDELETVLDDRAGADLGQPVLFEYSGCSADGTVFALSGTLPAAVPLPARVLVCRAEGVLLEGWLSRIEALQIVGHVERWHSPASALVKGEKVFILPGNSHEAD